MLPNAETPNTGGRIRNFAQKGLLAAPTAPSRRGREAESRIFEPEKIDTTAGKLRWYRHRKALLQREVADSAGISRRTYIRFEEDGRDYYPPDKLEKIAQLLEVDLLELMDGYNLFLYHEQGKQIQARREALSMTELQYAEHLGVPLIKLRKWESNQVQIFKSTWEKYFK